MLRSPVILYQGAHDSLEGQKMIFKQFVRSVNSIDHFMVTFTVRSWTISMSTLLFKHSRCLCNYLARETQSLSFKETSCLSTNFSPSKKDLADLRAFGRADVGEHVFSMRLLSIANPTRTSRR